jgi:hypothetical protein
LFVAVLFTQIILNTAHGLAAGGKDGKAPGGRGGAGADASISISGSTEQGEEEAGDGGASAPPPAKLRKVEVGSGCSMPAAAVKGGGEGWVKQEMKQELGGGQVKSEPGGIKPDPGSHGDGVVKAEPGVKSETRVKSEVKAEPWDGDFFKTEPMDQDTWDWAPGAAGELEGVEQQGANTENGKQQPAAGVGVGAGKAAAGRHKSPGMGGPPSSGSGAGMGGGEGGALFRIKWHRIVLDEAQSIKNPRTLAAHAAWQLAASHRWCLSGTPIQNSVSSYTSTLSDLWRCCAACHQGADEGPGEGCVRKLCACASL